MMRSHANSSFTRDEAKLDNEAILSIHLALDALNVFVFFEFVLCPKPMVSLVLCNHLSFFVLKSQTAGVLDAWTIVHHLECHLRDSLRAKTVKLYGQYIVSSRIESPFKTILQLD